MGALLARIWRIKRATVVCCLGCLGFVHQVAIARTERWDLVVLIAGMIGFPLPAYLDERLRAHRGETAEPSPPATPKPKSDGSPSPSPSPSPSEP